MLLLSCCALVLSSAVAASVVAHPLHHPVILSHLAPSPSPPPPPPCVSVCRVPAPAFVLRKMDQLRQIFTPEELAKEFFEESDSHPEVEAEHVLKGKKCRNGLKRKKPVKKKDAPWQRMLDMNQESMNSIHDEASRDGKYFRRRFRMPFSLFSSLIKVMLDEQWFPRYGSKGEGPMDCTKTAGASLQVKVLSCLRVLGRGVVFDECFDGSGCGEESIRVFFHNFVFIFSRRLFSHVIKPPTTVEEIASCTGIYQSLGMGPAVGSTDCTHISLGNCPNRFKVSCTGKSGKPTMAYSLTCSHSRKIFYVSAGFMGAHNDKHISKLDSFITAVGELEIYKNFEWTMDVTDTSTVQRKGVFLICDGGYHKWAHMICGLKHTSQQWHSLWSIQLESVRKDVECAFGILKCRFQILNNYYNYVGRLLLL